MEDPAPPFEWSVYQRLLHPGLEQRYYPSCHIQLSYEHLLLLTLSVSTIFLFDIKTRTIDSGL
jgi:hypothetical protein